MALSQPPIAGLQDISPIVSIFIVIKTVLAPILDEAEQLQHQHAPPITTTSKFFMFFQNLFTNTKTTEYII